MNFVIFINYSILKNKINLFLIYLIGDIMQLNIEKKNFCKIDGLISIKNHLEKIINLEINNSKARGTVVVDISYNDLEGLECFKSLELPFELDMDSLKIIDVLINKLDIYYIEGQGLEINYELVINYMTNDDKSEPLIIEEENIEKIKEDMKEFYEDKLSLNLNRDDVVITTKGIKKEPDFLNFFDKKEKYYKLKTLYVSSVEELEQIALEYNIKLEELMLGYDKKSNKVIFKIE